MAEGETEGEGIESGSPNKWKKFTNSMKSFGSKIGKKISNMKRPRLQGFGSDSQHNFLHMLLWLFIIAVILTLVFLFVTSIFFPAAIILGAIWLFRTSFVRNNPMVQFFLIIIIIGMILFFFAPMLLGDTGVVSATSFNKIATKIATSTVGIMESWKTFNPMTSFNNFWEKQKAIATGGYFEGEVERSKDDTKLGIYIENIEGADPIFYEGEEVTVWARLKGKSLDEEISVIMDCNASNGNEEKISSASSFNFYSYDWEDFDCKFNKLPPGAIKITFFADYPFKTLGYTKAYFMDHERVNSLRRQEIDPLDNYNIRDKRPLAVYTNGPIKVGIGTAEYQPIRVKENGERLFVLGITLENKWDGNIKEINDLEIQVPISMDLDIGNCDHDMVSSSSSGCINRCDNVQECKDDCSLYRFYELSSEGKKKLKNIERYQTIKCPVVAYTREDVLGNSPLSTKYFRVMVAYEYHAEEFKTFYIKKDSFE